MSKTKRVRAPALKGIHGIDLKGKHAVLAQPAASEHLPIRHNVVLCTDGFGCHPQSMGSAVFGTRVVAGTSHRFARYDFTRLATDVEIKDAKEFYKRNSFEAVCRRHERGHRLLLCIYRYPSAMRLVRHKKEGTYKLFAYVGEDDAWSLASGGTAYAVPDELLVDMHKWLNEGRKIVIRRKY
jgi:hypothetical protein